MIGFQGTKTLGSTTLSSFLKGTPQTGKSVDIKTEPAFEEKQENTQENTVEKQGKKKQSSGKAVDKKQETWI